jgi:hypothetical protein
LSSISVAGDVSGAISIAAPSAAGSGTLTLPTGTDTLIGKATTDTLTNKSIAATQLTGTIAAAALPAGSVLQVVNATYGTSVSTASSTFSDTGLTASITPKFTTSKILVLISENGVQKSTNNTYAQFSLVRNGTTLNYFEVQLAFTNTTATNSAACSFSYLDSPASISAVVYKTQFASATNNAAVNVQSSNGISSITLMEIAQ